MVPYFKRAPLHVTSMLATLNFILVVGCYPVDIPKDPENTGDTGDTETTECDGAFSSSGLVYDEITALCVSGESSVGVPPDFEVEVPFLTNSIYPAPYTAYPSWTDYDSGSDRFLMEVTNGSGALLNSYGSDGTSWPWEHGPDCSDYTIDGVDFYVIDGLSYGWTNIFAADCEVEVLPLPAAPNNKVPSGPQACVAGEGDFEFAIHRVFGSDGANATLWLTPILEDGTAFPERAWLRELEVVSWGDATNLWLAGYNAPIGATGFGLNGGTDIPKPSSGPTVLTWAAGVVPMSTLMGTEAIPSAGTVELPKVHLTWSCPANGSTHWVNVPGRTGHAAIVPSTYGIDHRVVFWIANDQSTVRIAPEGRYTDYIESDLVTAPSGGKTFEVRLPVYDVIFTGRLVKPATVYQLKDAVITVNGTPVTLSDQTLTTLN
jgi:hypothetical protein